MYETRWNVFTQNKWFTVVKAIHSVSEGGTEEGFMIRRIITLCSRQKYCSSGTSICPIECIAMSTCYCSLRSPVRLAVFKLLVLNWRYCSGSYKFVASRTTPLWSLPHDIILIVQEEKKLAYLKICLYRHWFLWITAANWKHEFDPRCYVYRWVNI